MIALRYCAMLSSVLHLTVHEAFQQSPFDRDNAVTEDSYRAGVLIF
jgi:hypothetical protein